MGSNHKRQFYIMSRIILYKCSISAGNHNTSYLQPEQGKPLRCVWLLTVVSALCGCEVVRNGPEPQFLIATSTISDSPNAGPHNAFVTTDKGLAQRRTILFAETQTNSVSLFSTQNGRSSQPWDSWKANSSTKTYKKFSFSLNLWMGL